jgi:hypothetical protein
MPEFTEKLDLHLGRVRRFMTPLQLDPNFPTTKTKENFFRQTIEVLADCPEAVGLLNFLIHYINDRYSVEYDFRDGQQVISPRYLDNKADEDYSEECHVLCLSDMQALAKHIIGHVPEVPILPES